MTAIHHSSKQVVQDQNYLAQEECTKAFQLCLFGEWRLVERFRGIFKKVSVAPPAEYR